MVQTTYSSSKRKRTYVRRFDYDDARERHAAGESYASLARRYRVHPTTVRRVVVPGLAAEMDAYAREWGARKRAAMGPNPGRPGIM